MIVLGYSGLDGSLEFRKNELKNISQQEIAATQGMDSAAALLIDGKIIAASEEERFTNVKHTCAFPIHAIKHCMDTANITLADVDAICHGFDFSQYKELYLTSSYNQKFYEKILSTDRQIDIFRKYFPDTEVKDKFKPTPHHLAHAASSFYLSNFQDALVLVADGLGEMDSLSVYHGTSAELKHLSGYNIFSSIGLLYSIITMYLGFYPNNDEYKIMGLAPYGDPVKYQDFFQKEIELDDSGAIFISAFSKNKTELEKQTYRGTIQYLISKLGVARDINAPIEQRHKDIARALQDRVNQALVHCLQYWKQKTQCQTLCLAGGVALNCVTNGVILQSKLFKEIFIQPAAGDAGTALGSALYYYHNHPDKKIMYYSKKEQIPYYGPSFTDNDIECAARKFKDSIVLTKMPFDKLCSSAAKSIACNKVIAWMQGKMEYGPRALGNRSILANPSDPKARSVVNRLVKKRETFRPFAPSVKQEHAHVYFDITEGLTLPFMLFTVAVRPDYVHQFPSITHVDRSARVQTVSNEVNPMYWGLLDAVEIETGYALVLNTSFNIKGQAIVCYPETAIQTFLDTEIDLLYIGNYLISRVGSVENKYYPVEKGSVSQSKGRNN